MELLERINKVMTTTERSVRSFANKLGLPQPSVNYYLKGERKLSVEFLEAILIAYPELSAEWLMRGTGSMYLEQTGMASEELPSIGESYYNKLVEEMEQMKQHINSIETKVG